MHGRGCIAWIGLTVGGLHVDTWMGFRFLLEEDVCIIPTFLAQLMAERFVTTTSHGSPLHAWWRATVDVPDPTPSQVNKQRRTNAESISQERRGSPFPLHRHRRHSYRGGMHVSQHQPGSAFLFLSLGGRLKTLTRSGGRSRRGDDLGNFSRARVRLLNDPRCFWFLGVGGW